MIAFCGLECARCPAFLATRAGDMRALAEVAARWSENVGEEIRPEEILCDGCDSDSGRRNRFCAVCAVRNCCKEKRLPNCAHCDRYPCETLDGHPAFTEEARANLALIRDAL